MTAMSDVYRSISERNISNSICWSPLTVTCYHGNNRCYVEEVRDIMTILSGINPDYQIKLTKFFPVSEIIICVSLFLNNTGLFYINMCRSQLQGILTVVSQLVQQISGL